MNKAKLFTTISGHVIPIDNIDYIGPIERPYSWGYSVYTKSGAKIWVEANDSRAQLHNDRVKLIELINE